MNKLKLKDRFNTTMNVVDKLDPEDELHISLSAVGKMMLIPIFLSKDQVTELINHLQNVIENDLWRCVENSLTKKQKSHDTRRKGKGVGKQV